MDSKVRSSNLIKYGVKVVRALRLAARASEDGILAFETSVIPAEIPVGSADGEKTVHFRLTWLKPRGELYIVPQVSRSYVQQYSASEVCATSHPSGAPQENKVTVAGCQKKISNYNKPHIEKEPITQPLYL